jgi:hypothetical protein
MTMYPIRYWVALLGLAPNLLSAQVQELKLPPANSRFDPGLQYIASVRELRDGRVLMTDPRGKGLVLVDFDAKTVQPAARKGRGPGEYSFAVPLLPLAGDSSLMAEGMEGIWYLLDGAKIVAAVPPSELVKRATDGFAQYTDARGFVYLTREPPPKGGKRRLGKDDSVFVVRVHRTTGKTDTIARLRRESMETTVSFLPDGRVENMTNRVFPMMVGEQMTVFRDGSIAIARIEPYRVDWLSPDGKWTHGAPLPFDAIKVTEKEKQFYRKAYERAYGSPFDNPYRINEWPSILPPFAGNRLAGMVLPLSDGRVMVRRLNSADRPENTYDIVNRRGRLESRLVLPGNETILSVTSRAAYVLETDEDGAQWIRRHLWPPERKR